MKTREEIIARMEREIETSKKMFSEYYPKAEEARKEKDFDKVEEYERYAKLALDRKFLLETILAWEAK